MSAWSDERRRRIEQIADCLRLMGLRRQKVVKDDCFLIFEEADPEDMGHPSTEEAANVRVEALVNGEGDAAEDDAAFPQPADWREDEPFRYLQFAFLRDRFYLELPNNTLFPNEAEILLRRRHGFYYAQSRRDLPWVRAYWNDMLQWDPLQKIYLYRDEESAAEDTAFIFYDLWKFPLGWRWRFKAASFFTDHTFEQGKPLE